jgi:hypothetical protein
MKHGLNLVGISLHGVVIARDMFPTEKIVFIFASAARSTDKHLHRLH